MTTEEKFFRNVYLAGEVACQFEVFCKVNMSSRWGIAFNFSNPIILFN